MSFTTLNLTGERVLVKGTDAQGTDGQTILDAGQWNEIKRHVAIVDAQQDFDAAVEEFYAPLMAAADSLDAVAKREDEDEITYVVVHEGTEAKAGRDEVRMRLTHDSVVLRLIEDGDTDRLVWVGDQLEVLATLPVAAGNGTVPQQRASQDPHAFDEGSEG